MRNKVPTSLFALLSVTFRVLYRTRMQYLQHISFLLHDCDNINLFDNELLLQENVNFLQFSMNTVCKISYIS